MLELRGREGMRQTALDLLVLSPFTLCLWKDTVRQCPIVLHYPYTSLSLEYNSSLNSYCLTYSLTTFLRSPVHLQSPIHCVLRPILVF